MSGLCTECIVLASLPRWYTYEKRHYKPSVNLYVLCSSNQCRQSDVTL